MKELPSEHLVVKTTIPDLGENYRRIIVQVLAEHDIDNYTLTTYDHGGRSMRYYQLFIYKEDASAFQLKLGDNLLEEFTRKQMGVIHNNLNRKISCLSTSVK